MNAYNPKEIEKKWQEKWESDGLYTAHEDYPPAGGKKKFYALIEFPYPSGDGLHTGHPRSFTAMDVIARKRRMEGYSVLYPIGWDAFGLPAENYAIKTGRQPAEITKENIATFKRQIKSLGISFDWTREVNTTDPKYFKWTQWIFLRMLKAGLAYKAKMPINWCPKCKIGLANEEAVGGVCERCGGPTEKREKEQWMLAITKYAERLHKDLDDVNYLERIKIQQRNWIGRSEGVEISYPVDGLDASVTVFTTRHDTNFGATFLALAPDGNFVKQYLEKMPNKSDVEAYIALAKKKTEIERASEEKEKTGAFTGLYATHPLNGSKLPLYVADFVLGNYGTGALVGVPAHDERDFAFAKKYNLPIIQTIAQEFGEKRENEERRDGGGGIIFDPETQKYAFLRHAEGRLGVYGGGVDKNEDIQAGVTREVIEESGLYDFKHVEKVASMYAHFYNTLRKVSRFTKATCFLFILNSTETKEVKHESHENYVLDWATPEEALKNWEGYNNIGLDHWRMYLREAVARAIELGYDTTSDPKKFISRPYTEEGIVVNSGEFDEMTSAEAREAIARKLGATKKITYKLRDWVFSRQRYWGEPIPVVYCPLDGIVPLEETELPLTLPPVENYQPTDNGDSPLAQIKEWVNTLCPVCGGPAKRETDTMPNWAGSSWYYLRYCDPDNEERLASPEKLKYWTPIDWYNGGMEHTTLHLLYSRFWHKFLFDEGVVPTSEPYAKRTSQGMILASNGEKMSKSKGNVINPDKIVDQFGADAFRLYELFMGPFDQAIAWNSDSLAGVYRFIERVWNLQEKVMAGATPNSEIEILLNQTIKKVSDDIEDLKFNTAISSLMILVNKLGEEASISSESYSKLLLLLAPFTPHVVEELHSGKTSIHTQSWPAFDASKLQKDVVEIVVQVGGKIRGRLAAKRGLSRDEALNMANADQIIRKWVGEEPPKRVIFIPDKLLNIVASLRPDIEADEQ